MQIISATAQIHPTARLAPDVSVGHFSVIGAGVSVGAGGSVGNHVVIHDEARLGVRCRVDDHAVIGKQPMRAARSAATTPKRQPGAYLGDDVIIGTGAILYAGSRVASRVLVADLATVREEVTVGEATIVGRGVAIENGTSVGARCKLETNAYVTAYSVIEDDVFVAPGVLTSNDRFLGRTKERFQHFGGPIVRKGARLAVGAVLLPGVEVSPEAVVGAGAVLTTDARAGMIHVGVPARAMREVPEGHRLGSDELDSPDAGQSPVSP
jgi:UDP-2-acetamido-3-amino-2,3-dideoxy-glucuronate N-acetyltransferase